MAHPSFLAALLMHLPAQLFHALPSLTLCPYRPLLAALSLILPPSSPILISPHLFPSPPIPSHPLSFSRGSVHRGCARSPGALLAGHPGGQDTVRVGRAGTGARGERGEEGEGGGQRGRRKKEEGGREGVGERERVREERREGLWGTGMMLGVACIEFTTPVMIIDGEWHDVRLGEAGLAISTATGSAMPCVLSAPPSPTLSSPFLLFLVLPPWSCLQTMKFAGETVEEQTEQVRLRHVHASRPGLLSMDFSSSAFRLVIAHTGWSGVDIRACLPACSPVWVSSLPTRLSACPLACLFGTSFSFAVEGVCSLATGSTVLPGEIGRFHPP